MNANRGCVLTSVVLVLAGASAVAWAQSPPVGGIYTCVDATGRRLNSDSPIPECNDREQKVLNPSGTVKTKVGPALTALERAELDKKEKKEAEEQEKAAEEKRRSRALLTRYPNKQVHDQERAEALAQIAAVVKAANTRIEELTRQRGVIDREMEFYKADPSKAPAYLRRQIDENNQSQVVQKHFITAQDAEAKRVNARFDDELVRLKQLWATLSK